MSSALRSKTEYVSYGIKLPNRRVRGHLMADGSTQWEFIKLENGIPVRQSLGLTSEALWGMFAIAKEMQKWSVKKLEEKVVKENK